jgi:hypothetical protein
MAVCRCVTRTSTTSPVRPTELKLSDPAAELIAVARSQRETRRRIGRPRAQARFDCRAQTVRAANDARLGWTTGGGSRSRRGSVTASSCRSARSSASLTARPAGGAGHRPAPAANCGASPLRRACDGGSLRISCATPTRPRWRVRGCRCPSSSASSGHAHLGVTSTYLQGIDTTEIINTVHGRRPPVIPASAGLRL